MSDNAKQMKLKTGSGVFYYVNRPGDIFGLPAALGTGLLIKAEITTK